MEGGIKDVLNELKGIRVDINFIKNHIEDSFLTEEEELRVEESLEELRQGKTTSLEDLM